MEELTTKELTTIKSLIRVEILENNRKIELEKKKNNCFSVANINWYETDNRFLNGILAKLEK